jgi:hypothetical protein
MSTTYLNTKSRGLTVAEFSKQDGQSNSEFRIYQGTSGGAEKKEWTYSNPQDQER